MDVLLNFQHAAELRNAPRSNDNGREHQPTCSTPNEGKDTRTVRLYLCRLP